MPGYKSLSDHVTGELADDVRRAEVLLRAGEREEAVLVFESTLAEFARTGGALPGWLCGRLAVLYRSLGRHDDEVILLERYRETHTSDDARTRYDARLSKAQALAERTHKSESTAISSVRLVIRGSKESSRRARAVVLAAGHTGCRPNRRGSRSGSPGTALTDRPSSDLGTGTTCTMRPS
jgi:hypothetical protein